MAPVIYVMMEWRTRRLSTRQGGHRVDFVSVVDQAIALLRQRGRVTYRTLQLQFTLDDTQLAALKDELLYSQPQVVDDAGRGLTWTRTLQEAPPSAVAPSLVQDEAPLTYTPPH